MPRKTRSEQLTPEIPNHIILRGNNRRRLFSYPSDYRMFLWVFARACKQHRCKVHALCLMTNHVHDLSTPPSVIAATNCVARFAQRYAQFRNAKRGGTGKLFEERFRSKPVVDDRHLLAATLYIDANPVRAGVVKDPLDYPWSTYAFHAGFANRSEIPSWLWTPSPLYLSLGVSASERANAYRRMFDAYVAAEDEYEFGDLVGLDEPYTRRLLRPNGSRAAESTFPAGTRLIPED